MGSDDIGLGMNSQYPEVGYTVMDLLSYSLIRWKIWKQVKNSERFQVNLRIYEKTNSPG